MLKGSLALYQSQGAGWGSSPVEVVSSHGSCSAGKSSPLPAPFTLCALHRREVPSAAWTQDERLVHGGCQAQAATVGAFTHLA